MKNSFLICVALAVTISHALHLRSAANETIIHLEYSDIAHLVKPLVNSTESLFTRKQLMSPTALVIHSTSDLGTNAHYAPFPNLASRVHKTTSIPQFTCESLPVDYDPHYLCSGVVDYSFMVETGSTIATLEAQARVIATPYNSFINTGCLSDIKRLICSTVFQPCVLNVVSGDISTYQHVNGSALPSVKPCESLCSATSAAGSTCKGVLEMLGLGHDCSSNIYDHTSTPLSAISGALTAGSYPVCNDLPKTMGTSLVAEPAEPYIGSACKGIVTAFYVSNSLDPTLAPLLPPYVLQTVTEYVAAATLGFMPKYALGTCQTVFPQLFCSTFFMSPHASSDLAFLFGGPVYVPSFPNHRMCELYTEQCASMIALAPAFGVDCDSTVQVGDATLQMYPSANQTIVSLVLSPTDTVKLSSPPFVVDQSTAPVYETQCPHGTTVPDDLSKKAIVWVMGACAVSCPSATYTPSEYASLYENIRIASWLGFVMSTLQLINLSAIKSSRRNMYIVISVVCSALTGLVQVVPLEAVGMGNTRDLVCDSNASWYTIKSYNESAGAVSCTVTGFVSLYLILLSFWFIVPLSAEIWLRVVKGVKDVQPYSRYYFWGTFATYIMFCLLATFYAEADIMAPASSLAECLWYPTSRFAAYYVLTIPCTIYLVTALVLNGHAIYVCVTVSLRVKDGAKNPFSKIWKSYSMLILFLAIFVVVYPIIVWYYRTKLGFVDVPKFTNGAIEWFVCMFTNFKSEDDLSYLDTCGHVPPIRIPMTENILPYYIIVPLDLLLVYITLSADAKILWRNILMVVLQKSGFAAAAKYVGSPLGRASYLSVIQKRSSTVSSSYGEDEEEGGTVTTKPSIAKKVEDSFYANVNRMLSGSRDGAYRKETPQMKPIAVVPTLSVTGTLSSIQLLAIKTGSTLTDGDKDVQMTARNEDDDVSISHPAQSARQQHRASAGVVELFHITDVSAAVIDANEEAEACLTSSNSIQDIPI